MYIPPKITQMLHEDRVQELQNQNMRRSLNPENTSLFKRIWMSVRSRWYSNNEWISMPLEAEPHEITAELLNNQPNPSASKNTRTAKPRYQRSDLA